ncbi:fungal-specific transcription factor [Dactylonectria macrodidyma]|uniref:Fungal-specific transcription factor n=1 Tax=Dactylonectria macrodidyma TaxID=307937 RepID=A0A9P9FQI9_9HYPO|nr:fungal-specific transcription factor [Dactylonectria macrodidyma]
MTTRGTPSSQVGDGTTTRPVACLHCRQRRSYCSKERPTCSRCRDNGMDCSYEEARKILVNESYLRELERKARAHDAATSQSQEAAASRIRTSLEDDEDDFILEGQHPLLEPFTQLSVDKPSTSFKGPASSDNFLRSVSKLSGLHDDDGSLDVNPNFYEPGALPSRRGVFGMNVRLPPVDIARRLFAAQYTYIGTIFAFTDPKETFDQQLLQAYCGLPDAEDKDGCLLYAKVLVILAFGQLYSVNQWVDFRGPPGFGYFTSALNLLPDAHEEGSVLCVETLALAGYFMQNMNRRDAAFLYIGMALRMATSLGLHQEVGFNTSTGLSHSQDSASALDSAAREHRRRVWWSVYSLDRILSVKSGNPITIQDEDIGVDLPSRLPEDPEYCPAIVLRHYTQLSRILGEIHMTIYRKASKETPKSGHRLMASVQGIILRLSKWNRDLPDELRFDPARLSISRESVSTFAHYYQCINMTARPLLFHVVQKRLQRIRDTSDPGEKEWDWREGLSQTTVRVIDMCIGAAQDTINMMIIAAQRDLVATYGYMDGEHIFSATIVLVMVCLTFPTNAANTVAMNAGLDLLRGMGERGNTHMGARYELLANLRATAMPGAVVHASRHSFSLSLSSANSLMNTNAHPSFVPMLPVSIGDHQGNLAPLGYALSDGNGERLTFPVVDNSSLGEPFYDENTSPGIDIGLWEEGFADPAMDVDFDLTQWTSTAGMSGLGQST